MSRATVAFINGIFVVKAFASVGQAQNGYRTVVDNFAATFVRFIHASVRDNIALRRSAARLSDIKDAARVVRIHERILAFPRGYDSVVGEDAQLSGGERQQVSIACTMLFDPPVLMLDKATATVDACNEKMIQNAQANFAQGRSVLVIAHRLNTVMHANKPRVLEQDCIVGQGTHAELLARNGIYATFWAQSHSACNDPASTNDGEPVMLKTFIRLLGEDVPVFRHYAWVAVIYSVFCGLTISVLVPVLIHLLVGDGQWAITWPECLHSKPVFSEFIQRANPDVIYLIDRIAVMEHRPVLNVLTFSNPLLKQTSAWKNNGVICVDAAA